MNTKITGMSGRLGDHVRHMGKLKDDIKPIKKANI